jgi:hypothetical protein
MTKLAEIQEAIRQLAPQEQQELRLWLDETVEETPAMLAAIDVGLHSLQSKGAKPIPRAQLETTVRQWSGGLSRHQSCLFG